VITLDEARDMGACAEALVWGKKHRDLSWEEAWARLKRDHLDWACWVMMRVPECPADMEGLDSEHRAWVMTNRKECPVDLTGLDSVGRARVMMVRKDCPIDLEGMSSWNRMSVMIARQDCPVDLEGLTIPERERVIAHRGGGKVYDGKGNIGGDSPEGRVEYDRSV